MALNTLLEKSWKWLFKNKIFGNCDWNHCSQPTKNGSKFPNFSGVNRFNSLNFVLNSLKVVFLYQNFFHEQVVYSKDDIILQ